MDIYRYINSRDIRDHLKKIKYEFNALEASWLVYQCSFASLAEKNDAWNWIIDNMPVKGIKRLYKAISSFLERITTYFREKEKASEQVYELPTAAI